MMRLLMLAWMLLYGAGAWAADPGACYSIQDADARAWCLAKAHGDPAWCYSIQSAELRSMCLAQVRR